MPGIVTRTPNIFHICWLQASATDQTPKTFLDHLLCKERYEFGMELEMGGEVNKIETLSLRSSSSIWLKK